MLQLRAIVSVNGNLRIQVPHGFPMGTGKGLAPDSLYPKQASGSSAGFNQVAHREPLSGKKAVEARAVAAAGDHGMQVLASCTDFSVHNQELGLKLARVS